MIDLVERLGDPIRLHRSPDRERAGAAAAVELTADAVGKPAFFPQLGVEPGRELAAQDLIQEQGRLERRISPGQPGVADPNNGLSGSGPIEKQQARRSGSLGVGDRRQRDGWAAPGRQPTVELVGQCIRVDVASGDYGRPAGDQISCVECGQVLAVNTADTLDRAGQGMPVRMILAVKRLEQRAVRS